MSVSVGYFLTFKDLFESPNKILLLGIMSHGDFIYLTGPFEPHYSGHLFVDKLYQWLCEKFPQHAKMINEWRKQWDSNLKILDLIEETLIEEEWFYNLIFLKVHRKTFQDVTPDNALSGVDDLKQTEAYKQHCLFLDHFAETELRIKKYAIHGMRV